MPRLFDYLVIIILLIATADYARADSMVVGWPDAIKCSGTNGFIVLNNYFGRTSINDVTYVLSNSNGTADVRLILRFELDGDFKSLTNSDTSGFGVFDNLYASCNNKSISQLYTDGQAFDLVPPTTTDIEGIVTDAMEEEVDEVTTAVETFSSVSTDENTQIATLIFIAACAIAMMLGFKTGITR